MTQHTLSTLHQLSLLVVAALLLVAPVQAQPKEDTGAKILKDARAMAGLTSSARRTYIESQLEAASIAYERRPWEAVRAKGVNLELRIGPKDGQAILMTAHFDVRDGSDGANNNASGCAVLLQLAKDAVKHVATGTEKKKFVFLFLDGSEARFAGSTAFCELYDGEPFQTAFNFDLCGSGDRIVLGPSARPLANSAVAIAAQAAAGAGIKTASWSGFIPGDHRIFARHGLEAAAISIIPSAQLGKAARRFGKNDRSAPMPAFFKEAIRGRDEAGKLQASALLLAVRLGRALIAADTSGHSAGMPLVKDVKKKQKALLELFEEGTFEQKRDAIRDLGFNGTLDLLVRKLRKDEGLKAGFEELIPRLFSGKDLRAELTGILASGADHPPEKLILLKQKITWDKSGRYYKCLP